MRKFPTWLPALLIALPLLAYIAYPLGAVLYESCTLELKDRYACKIMGWDFKNQPAAAPLRYLAAMKDPLARDALYGTLKISVLSALTSGLWGFALALLWGQRKFPGRRICMVLGHAPLLLPPLVGTLAWYQLAGPGSWLQRVLGLSGFTQVLLLHTYSFGLLVFTYVSAALEGVDRSAEEAAKSLGAGAFGAFRVGVWPALRAPLLAAVLLAFMASAASFSGPYILDNGSHYLTVEILNCTDPGLKRGYTVLLALTAFAALPPFLWLNRTSSMERAGSAGLKGGSRRALPPSGTQARWLYWGLSIPVLILLCAPPLVTVWEAFTQSAQTGLDSQAVVSLGGGFARLQARDWATLGNSALYAFGAAVLNLVVAVAFALALRGAPTWAALPGECAVMLALALPGSVIGIAILSVFYAGSWLSLGMALGRTGWILVLAYFVRNLPLAVRPVRAALQAGGSELESAAQNLGAGRLRTWLRVTLPLIAPELFAAFLICFVTGLGEFVASELLYSPGTAPVSVRINELFRNDPAPAYALALILMLICALAAGLSAWARRRWSLAEK